MLETIELDLTQTINKLHILESRRRKLKRLINDLRYLYYLDCQKEQNDYDLITKEIDKLRRFKYKQRKLIENLKERQNESTI